MSNIRAEAAKILYAVGERGQSLATLLPDAELMIRAQDRPLLSEIVYGSCRWYYLLRDELKSLMDRRLRQRDRMAEYLLIVGLYQLRFTRIPDHAAIHETVAAVNDLNITKLKGLVNGVLRSFSRKEEAEYIDTESHNSHPQWMVDKLTANWPDRAEFILKANNLKAPLTLRVNRLKQSREEYLKQLEAAGIEAEPTKYSTHGIRLITPYEVTDLPGYTEGFFSVQDEAAQLCTTLLEPKPGQNILDACAAPGGKTTAIIEASQGQARVTALDSDPNRLRRVHENLARLGQQANVICADGTLTDQWWDGDLYDGILLDAPCSATGVIRRHPDIKLLRKESDITPLADVQLSLLKAMWPLLKPGGRLVYATCSVFPQENSRIIGRFINQNSDAVDIPNNESWGIECEFGRQLLPEIDGHDGFYYAVMQKP